MIRHIEFEINSDLTCWGEKEDFEMDTDDTIKESLEDYIINDAEDLLSSLKIKKVWYEED